MRHKDNKHMNKKQIFEDKEKVIAYIDGFNLYFGMTKVWKDIKWLNVKKMARSLLKPTQELIQVKYFTSRVANNPEKEKRQTTYLEALQTKGVTIIYGKYQPNTEECKRCGNIWSKPKEKITDVNMIVDAYQDKYDTALLISGDSDLVPPIKAVHQNFKNKRVVVAFPPNRKNISVSKVAKGSFTIGRKKLKDHQLSRKVIKPDGFVLEKPTEWK